jgi:hypothetical protein
VAAKLRHRVVLAGQLGHGRRPAVGWEDISDLVSRHRFPPTVIQHAVWLYLRFTLSYRDVEELLAQRGAPADAQAAQETGLRAEITDD